MCRPSVHMMPAKKITKNSTKCVQAKMKHRKKDDTMYSRHHTHQTWIDPWKCYFEYWIIHLIM